MTMRSVPRGIDDGIDAEEPAVALAAEAEPGAIAVADQERPAPVVLLARLDHGFDGDGVVPS